MTLVELEDVINWLNANVGFNDLEGIIDWDWYMGALRSDFKKEGAYNKEQLEEYILKKFVDLEKGLEEYIEMIKKEGEK